METCNCKSRHGVNHVEVSFHLDCTCSYNSGADHKNSTLDMSIASLPFDFLGCVCSVAMADVETC